MTILSDKDLEFAKEHLNRFADSDFFPPLYEYEAVWKNWSEFKKDATKANVVKLIFPTPFQLPAPKPNRTFRMVHQLDPLSCIAYTALAHASCVELESRRIDQGLKVSCSYRSAPDTGSFFSAGTGYQDFLDQTKTLCEKYKYILSTDISDFYNQVYTHRVRNSISGFGPSWEDLAKDVEGLIHSLNNQSSKGIPTGPNASIIFSEALLLDVDELLHNKGSCFCRFVDDFRIFSDSREDLAKTLETLSEYLYDHHRLHLSANKTYVLETSEFLQKEYFNHYRIEVDEAFSILGKITYGNVASVVEFEDESKAEINPFGTLIAKKSSDSEEGLPEIVGRLSETIKKTDRADLNLLKALLRRCRLLNSDAFVPLLALKFEVFLPVFHDLAKTMRQLYANGQTETVLNFLKAVYVGEFINLKFIRYWSDWLASQDRKLLEESGASALIRASGDIRHKAYAAVATNDLAWVRGFRSNIDQLGDWDRRAVVGASRILSKDERGPFLSGVRKRFDDRVVDRLLLDHVLSH